MFEFLSSLHFGALIKIVLIDLSLGIDNAIVIAMACAMLAPNLRNKAIAIGTGGAILARILLLAVGFWLVQQPFLHIIAGAYLVYLAFSMVGQEDEDDMHIKQSNTLWGAVAVITISDVMFSLDNVVALVGASDGTGSHALGYTIFGILVSIPIILFASKYLVTLLDKFPVLVNLGAALIAYVGVEMFVKEDWARVGEILSNHNTQLGLALASAAVVALYFPVKKRFHQWCDARKAKAA